MVSGCVRVSDGAPVAAPSAPSTIASPSAPDADPPGIQPTQRTPVPAGSVTCAPPNRPPVSVAAAVDDPAAPRITVGVPEGWGFGKGTGDVAVKLEGPQGLSATVTIAPTTLDPEAAFRRYADQLVADAAVSTVSMLPAELCGYSGQKLMGGLSDTPQDSIEFSDRVVHVWTNTADYLIAVHVEGPAGVDGFTEASTVITDNVELTIP